MEQAGVLGRCRSTRFRHAGNPLTAAPPELEMHSPLLQSLQLWWSILFERPKIGRPFIFWPYDPPRVDGHFRTGKSHAAQAGEEEFGVGAGVLKVANEDFHRLGGGQFGKLAANQKDALVLVRVEQ